MRSQTRVVLVICCLTSLIAKAASLAIEIPRPLLVPRSEKVELPSTIAVPHKNTTSGVLKTPEERFPAVTVASVTIPTGYATISSTTSSQIATLHTTPTAKPISPTARYTEAAGPQCDRNTEAIISDIDAASQYLMGFKRAKCVQNGDTRGCTKLAVYGTAAVEMCGDKGWSVLCTKIAAWTDILTSSCKWRPLSFFKGDVSGGRYYPPEGGGCYIKISNS